MIHDYRRNGEANKAFMALCEEIVERRAAEAQEPNDSPEL
jgi:hypothetical protein